MNRPRWPKPWWQKLWRGELGAARRAARLRSCAWLQLEPLEHRTALSGGTLATALPLSFLVQGTAQITQFLSRPNEVDLYRVELTAGDRVEAGLDTQSAGGRLDGLLRVFDANGTQIALNESNPRLTFQAPVAGAYFIGVSSAPNDAYDPRVLDSGTGGGTTGLYTLNLRDTPGVPLAANLVGSSFRLGSGAAVWGDTISVNFTVDNRGAAAADPAAQVELLLSDNNTFSASSTVYTFPQTFSLADLGAAQTFASGQFALTLPDLATAAALGFPSTGPLYLGLRITEGATDTAGVYRGEDWAALTIVAPVPPGVTNLSQVNADLNTQATGTLVPNQRDTYTFTVTSAGRLSATVIADGTLSPQLTLSDPQGRPLVQSSSGRLVQYVEPGAYTLTVSARAGTGSYRLATEFAGAGPLGAPLPVGSTPYAVVAADLTNDGTSDLIVANQRDSTVSVFLGIGDGYFREEQTFDVGPIPFSVAVDDLNGDGRTDLVTANKLDGTVSVLLGNGDGTFQAPQSFGVGLRPGGVTIADLTGDGAPDLVVSNYGDGTVSVLLGNGDGTFQPQQVLNTGGSPVKVSVADVTGDGRPDLIVPDYGASTVGVLPGNGDGTFQPQRSSVTASGPYSIAVGDIDGDGLTDIVSANYSDNSVSVLLGAGDGSFQARRDAAVGALPYSIALADVNGDGRLDAVTANAGDNSVSVLLGNGDGSFVAPRRVDAGSSPRAVAVADVTGDGVPDIVTANRSDNTASVLVGNGDGSFQSQPSFAAAPSLSPVAVAVADLTGTGGRDIVTANFGDNSVSVLLRNPDGTFQLRQTFATGTNPVGLAVADLNGDGVRDIITANYGGSTVSVLLGNGDGTFQQHLDYLVGLSPQSVTVVDVNRDGIPDLIAPDKANNSATVLLGSGDGTFLPRSDFAAANSTRMVVVSDVNRDGFADLVTNGFTSVAVSLGNGDGSFQAPQVYATTGNTFALAVADLNGDGNPDIITTNAAGGTASVFRGNGDGTFQPESDFATGAIPYSVVAADVNGDGRPDLVTANFGDATVSVLLGNGDGTFQPQQAYFAGPGISSATVADLTGDGRLDIVTSNAGDSTVGILTGNGDGTFGTAGTVSPGTNLYSVAVADLTGDGKSDLVTANRRQNTVRVQPGNGDGTFQTGQTFAVGAQPGSVVVADLNGDGRLDLATTNSGGDSVSVLMGNGDGTFQPQATGTTGRSPRTVVAVDLNGDGFADLAVTNYDDDTVSVLLGNGDGTFQTQRIAAVGRRPYSVAVADLNGDGNPDLIAGNVGNGTVSVLRGNGDGTFQAQQTFAVGRQPFALTVADLNGDGRPDIATANYADNTASVLLGNGDGSFQTQTVLAVGAGPTAVAVSDLTDAGRFDIITTNNGDNTLSVLLANGTGTFQPARTFAAGQQPVMTAVADVNGDGIPDFATAGNNGGTVGVRLGSGAADFQPVVGASGTGSFNTPFLADLDGDGIVDSAILDRAGNILFRRGLAGSANSFASPVILNGTTAIGENRPARALTAVRTASGWALATADATFDDALSSPGQFVYTVSRYTIAANGAVSRTIAFTTPLLPTNIAAADLTGDGLDDLVVADALSSGIQVALQRRRGTFGAPLTRSVGEAPSGITFADVDGDSRIDIVVSNQTSGTATVLLNDAANSFTTAATYRTGLSFSSVSPGSAGATLTSLDRPVSLVAGDFTGAGRSDLVVVNRGTHSFTVLRNDGNGGFADAQGALTISTSSARVLNDQPGPAVTADFHALDGLNASRTATADLAVLMQGRDEVWIYTNNGAGTFTLGQQIQVGRQSTGLSVVPGSGPGLFDLLVGNNFGDVLRLVGNGDGTFTPPAPVTGDDVPLDVLPGQGTPVVLVANQTTNSVTIQMSTGAVVSVAPNVTVTTTAPLATVPVSSDVLAPGAVYWIQLEGAAGLHDAVVVASGSNSVLVYKTLAVNPQTGEPTFAAPVSYSVGTEPVALTVGYFNGSPVPSLLVVNKGSNDISVIFGDVVDGAWVGRAGPRLSSGGVGPVSAVLEPVNGSDVPALVVTNAGSGTIAVLPGIGRGGVSTGFFRDNAPISVAVPAAAIGPLTENYLPTAQGIYRFDPVALTVTQVFASSTLAAISVAANGQVVAGFAGGMLGLLQGTAGGNLAVTQTFSDARLTALGGLQATVLNGTLEVFASGAGTSNTVFEFVIATTGALPGGPGIDFPPPDAPGGNPFDFTLQQGIPTSFDPTPFAQTSETIDLQSVGSTGTFFAAVLSNSAAVNPNDSGSSDSGSTGLASGLVPDLVAALSTVLIGGAGSEDDTPPDPEAPGSTPLNDFITGIEDALKTLRKQIREREGVEEELEPPAPKMKEEKDSEGLLPGTAPRADAPADATDAAEQNDEQADMPLTDGADGVAPEERAAFPVPGAEPSEAVEVATPLTRDEETDRWLWFLLLLSGAWLWLDERPERRSSPRRPIEPL